MQAAKIIAIVAFGAALNVLWTTASTPSSTPAIWADWSPLGKALFLLIAFALMAYIWYSLTLSIARAGRKNTYYVSKQTVNRLDQQARGEDPPAVEE